LLALPLPILSFALSAVACVLVWRLDIGSRLARGFFICVFALIAISTLLIGLRFGYGVEQLAVIQRSIPLFIGPLIYLGFLALTQPATKMRAAIIVHLSIAAFAALLPHILPLIRPYFDLAIGTSYLFYSVALVLLWRKGDNSLVHAPLHLIRSLRLWMLVSAALLVINLVFDTGIAISFAMRRTDNAIQLISYGSIISTVSLILAIAVFSSVSSRRSSAKPASELPAGESTELEGAIRSLLMKSQLYLDTNLNLERLAKRLHVPARALSEAINQTQNMNVSQYVNGFRLQHAAKLLEVSNLNVTQVMDQSGFLTRSNFYREFERVYALSPIEYRKRYLGKSNGG